jgi:hypothetical protein
MESRVKVNCEVYPPFFPLTNDGPRLLNDVDKRQLHWKSNGKSNEDVEE